MLDREWDSGWSMVRGCNVLVGLFRDDLSWSRCLVSVVLGPETEWGVI